MSRATVVDLRPFERWIVDELEPAARTGPPGAYAARPGDDAAALYGVADMACIRWTLERLHPDAAERAGFDDELHAFADPRSGAFREPEPTHDELHATAFALGALELLGLAPRVPPRLVDHHRAPAAIEPFLAGLDWSGGVYRDSHRGAGLASILALAPDPAPRAWFDAWFDALDRRVDPATGMHGVGKPAAGDLDQVGGSFHYHFGYEHHRRRMPHAPARIDTVLALQRPDGCWHPANPLWLTLDGCYLLARTVRHEPHRRDDVRAAARRALGFVADRVLTEEGRAAHFDAPLGVHALTAAVSVVAECQLLLGADEVVTERPWRSVLDARPFI